MPRLFNLFYPLALGLIFAFSAIVFLLLFFVSAPYGKHSRKGWGPGPASRWAWFIMELPSALLPLIIIILAGKIEIWQIFFLCLWEVHYIYRSLIFPFILGKNNKPFPFLLILFALTFNLLNSFVNSYALLNQSGFLDNPFFILHFLPGLLLFISGFLLHFFSDRKLRLLRKKNQNGYQIPQGILYRYISCPNYFGEILQWSGWTLMLLNPAALAFLCFTIANLFPRAISHHKWYKNHFDDYPSKRKAIIPFLI